MTYSSTQWSHLHCHQFRHLRTSTTRRAHTSPPLKLDPSVIVEEETLPGYNPSNFCPIRIGDLLQDRYHIIGKLGYGSRSTVWLCRDLKSLDSSAYVALKIYTNNILKSNREIPIYKYTNSFRNCSHVGRRYVRALLDHFELEGPQGKHICLVHEAAGMNFEELRELLPNETFEPDLLRQSFRSIVRGLHFLHSEARVIHTGSSSSLSTICSRLIRAVLQISNLKTFSSAFSITLLLRDSNVMRKKRLFRGKSCHVVESSTSPIPCR